MSSPAAGSASSGPALRRHARQRPSSSSGHPFLGIHARTGPAAGLRRSPGRGAVPDCWQAVTQTSPRLYSSGCYI
jgi:hypothetical protein